MARVQLCVARARICAFVIETLCQWVAARYGLNIVLHLFVKNKKKIFI